MCTARRLTPYLARWSSIDQYRFVSVTLQYLKKSRRDHIGAVGIDVHSMFCHDSTAKTRSIMPGLDLRRGLRHIQAVHRDLRTNAVDPSSPLQKLSRTVTHIVSCTLNFSGAWFRLSHRVIQFPCGGRG